MRDLVSKEKKKLDNGTWGPSLKAVFWSPWTHTHTTAHMHNCTGIHATAYICTPTHNCTYMQLHTHRNNSAIISSCVHFPANCINLFFFIAFLKKSHFVYKPHLKQNYLRNKENWWERTEMEWGGLWNMGGVCSEYLRDRKSKRGHKHPEEAWQGSGVLCSHLFSLVSQPSLVTRIQCGWN